MASASMAAVRRALDTHPSRKAAAQALGLDYDFFRNRVPPGRWGGQMSDAMVASMHRCGATLDEVARVCGVSIPRVIRVVRETEAAEVNRIQFAAEGAAWRAYRASVAASQMGA